MKKSFPRGSEWRKWDLHVHTPASIVHNYGGNPDEVWEKFLRDLEALPPEVKVIGINDYLFLDGYKRVKEARDNGRLGNLDLVLPVIELRLDSFGGTDSKLSRVNYHVIFSEELDAKIIEQQFIAALSPHYVLNPTYKERIHWKGIITKESLTDLGTAILKTVPAEKLEQYGAPIYEGFNNLCVSLKDIQSALSSTYLNDHYITAIGKTEWHDLKWTDQSIASKKHLINSAQFVFIAAESPLAWSKSKAQLEIAGVNSRLLDCSDSHDYSSAKHKDRIGNFFTWIKADPTFNGLKQAYLEYENRVFIGDEPKKNLLVARNPTKYAQAVSIRKNGTSILEERWFDQDVQLNQDLVAIIGNKGSGKSALADVIGLLGNSKNQGHFSFLNPKKFCQPKDNKGDEFSAELKWISGESEKRKLSEIILPQDVEKVIYLPQNFIENACNELPNGEDSTFDQEIKKVIFSHIDEAEKQGKNNIEDLLILHEESTRDELRQLRERLHDINSLIVGVLEEQRPEFALRLRQQLDQKNKELTAHNAAIPKEVKKPDLDPGLQENAGKIVAEMTDLKKLREQLWAEWQGVLKKKEDVIRAQTLIKNVATKLKALGDEAAIAKTEYSEGLKVQGIAWESVFGINVNLDPLRERFGVLTSELASLNTQIDEQLPDSLPAKKLAAEQKLADAQSRLDGPSRLYQAYVQSLEGWERKRLAIIGTADEAETVKGLEKRLAEIAKLPERRVLLESERSEVVERIVGQLQALVATYQSVYQPAQRFIAQHPTVKGKLLLNFQVRLTDMGFESKFFEYVSQSPAGSFCGKEAGEKRIKELLENTDWNKGESVKQLLEEVASCLEFDFRSADKPATGISTQIRRNKSVLGFFDWLYSLEYLAPKYSLKFGDSELSQLSPGERGILLLVFYLLVDKRDIPIVIDQPEENLDNQTIYDLLVPCIKQAKDRRQIVIVTHNPNLAVVCDAEQIINATFSKKDACEVVYVCGSIESTGINKQVVNVLEGTRPAFNNRQSKYQN